MECCRFRSRRGALLAVWVQVQFILQRYPHRRRLLCQPEKVLLLLVVVLIQVLLWRVPLRLWLFFLPIMYNTRVI